MQRIRLHALVVLALLAVTGVSVNASAQPKPQSSTPSPEAVKRADMSFRNGNQLYAEKKWAEAEAAFVAAWELNPTYDVAANLGHTQYRLGKYREAAEHLSFALRTWPLIGAQEPRKLAQERLAEARAFVGSLKIQSEAEHADIFVDGKLVGRTPLDHEVFVDPGARKLEARHELHGTEMLLVKAEKGSTQTVRVTLGLEARRAPSEAAPIARPIKDEPRAGANTAIVIAGAGASGAALVAGVVFTLVANGKARVADKLAQPLALNACSLDPPAPGCDALRRERDAQYAFSNVALWGFVGAGVLGAGTVIYALAAPRVARQTTVRVTPVMGSGSGAVLVSGAW
jgi:tetratricopeptide (TPR) repeat protein